MPDVLYPNTTIESEATFTDQAGDEFDPDTVTCTVVDPDGEVTVEDFSDPSTFPPIGMTNESTGVYNLKFNVTKPGKYLFIWYGATSGGLKITIPESVTIERTA
jgi:hypothetical protein